MSDKTGDDKLYIVIVNQEKQYSTWLSHRRVPAGWRAVGAAGSKADCFDYIERIWTDMTPASVGRR
jgi:MbtH protein